MSERSRPELASEPAAEAQALVVPAWEQFNIWLSIGLQSFGGGAATLYLLRREMVERRAWLTNEEYTRYWGICQIAPGINILGFIILIGWRVAGTTGIALALAGLLLPSAAITVGLTAIYTHIERLPIVQSALHGVVPATIGLGLMLSFSMLRPLLVDSRKEGGVSLAIVAVILVLSVLLAAFTRISVVVLMWGIGGLAALANWLRVSDYRRSL